MRESPRIRATRVAVLAGVLASSACMPTGGVAQEPAPPQGMALASDLLAAAPFGPAREDRLGEQAFLQQYMQVRDYMPGFTPPVSAGIGQVVTALEIYLADFGPVTAEVTSEPDGIEVTYRPIYEDRSDADPGVTSNGSIDLDLPIDYFFEARNPYTGAIETKRRKCQYGCTVRFVFTP